MDISFVQKKLYNCIPSMLKICVGMIFHALIFFHRVVQSDIQNENTTTMTWATMKLYDVIPNIP